MIFTFCCVILHGFKGDITSEDKQLYGMETLDERQCIGGVISETCGLA